MTWHTLLIIFFTLLDLVCIIAVIFVERKNPASTIAWVLVIVFFPFVGFAFYLMFGSGFHVNQKKRYALKQVSDNLYKQITSRYIDRFGACGLGDGTPCSRLATSLGNAGEHYYTADNAAFLFTDGQTLFAAMKEDMRKAKKHIHLLYYIIRNDALGREIVGILTEKARKGVEVRVIYDSLGSFLTTGRMFRELLAAGGEVEAFSPLVKNVSSHLRLNYRNHRKITVIDGEIGYVGGMNIGLEYCGKHKRLHPWRDTQLRLTGSSVSLLQERFLLDWMSVRDDAMDVKSLEAYFPPPLQRGSLGMQIVSSGPDTAVPSIKNGLLEMLYTARKTAYIQTPYFIPDDSMLDALRIAVRAGVDVRIMLPGLQEYFFVASANDSYAWQLVDAGARVFRYHGFLHAKTVVIDGMAASIGSANIGNRSFTLNFEINAFVYDYQFAAACERVFLNDQEQCAELTEEWFRARPPIIRLSYGVTRLLAPLM